MTLGRKDPQSGRSPARVLRPPPAHAEELQKVIVGQDEVIEQIFAAIFTRGHCLLDGVPGLAKTLMVSTLGQILDVALQARSSSRPT